MTAIDHEPPGQIEVRQPGLLEALLDFKSVAPKLPRDKTATVATQKGTYTYRYTSLDTIAALTDSLLYERGLLWTTMPTIAEGKPALAYQLSHVPTGQQLAGVMFLPMPADTPQGHGSGYTYGRRYSKVAVLDLIADDDDDGQAAEAAAREYGSPTTHPTGGVDMRDHAKGLSNEAINAAREAIGLPKLEKPWSSLINIPEARAQEFFDALEAARAAS